MSVKPEDAVEMMRTVGAKVLFTKQHEFIENVDGEPWGVSLPETSEAELASVVLTGDEWERVAWYLLGKLIETEENK